MRTKTIILCTLILLVLLQNNVNGITITDNGKSNYSIVLSTQASESEIHGAQELQHFLQIITGAYLPLCRDNENISGPMILIGNSSALQKVDQSIDFKTLGDEGFIIKTIDPHLILAGGKLRGTMYAVYTFLEKLGCRWYSAEASKIPSIPTLTVESINEIQKPAFAYREPFWYDAFDADWAARNKNNGSRTKVDQRRGGKYKYWGGHNFHYLVPPAKFFGDHPEYYTFVNGKRIWEYAQLCLTNPELVRLTTRSILEVMDRDPGNDVYEISQMDWANWCTCEKCTALDEKEESHAATAVNFVNQIADRVKSKYPDKLIGTFAYRYTEKAPKTLQARDNVCIRLCNIIGCDAHPLTECPQNLRWFTQNMRKWNKLAKKIIIWDYVTNFSHYLMPFPNWYATWKDLLFFKENNVIGVFEEGAYESEASAGGEIESYLQAKNLWDPSIDYRDVLNDFLNGFYHKAAPAVRKYMDCLQSKVNDEGLHFNLYSPPTIALFSPSNLELYEKYLAEAAELAKDDHVAAYRVEEVRLGIRYVKLAQPVEHVLDGNLYKVSPNAPAYANLREYNDFVEDCKRHEIICIREHAPFESSIKVLRANVSNHKVLTLENTQLQVDVIPSLAGRIYRIIDKKTNRNFLRIPTTKEYPYPNVGGYSESPLSIDPLSYSLESTEDGQRIIMEGLTTFRSSYDALKIVRSIFLPRDKKEVRITSMLECAVPMESRPMRISPSLDLSLGNWEDVRSGVKTEKQSYAWKQLVKEKDELRQQVSISTSFYDKEIKSGEWLVINEKENAGILNVFKPGEIEMCSVTGDTMTGGIRMSLGGTQRLLKPGDKLTLSHTIIPIDNVKEFEKKNK